MKKLYTLMFLGLLTRSILSAQTNTMFTPYVQMGGMMYSSKQVTSAGVGPGIGLWADIHKHLIAKADVNIYWINGNAFTGRLAFGYKKTGSYAPAGFVMLSSVFGNRIEFLSEDGSRPANPVYSCGLQLCPLRFENSRGFVSVLETAYDFGNYKGRHIQVSLVSVGICFK